MTTMPAVAECTVSGCSYNHDGCSAYAITVDGQHGGAGCATFIPLDIKGGLSATTAQVGACTRSDCTHNTDLECTSDSIKVGPGTGDASANCLTFTAA